MTKNLSKLLPLLIIVVLIALNFFQSYEGGSSAVVGPDGTPEYVMDVLQHVQSTGKPMKNYVGGRTFQNREKRLPKTGSNGQKLKYKEWDVHKKVKGKNRGAERLVTGSDGSAYYTKDHYKTFKQIK